MTHWKVLVSNSETLSAEDIGAHRPTVTITGVSGGVFEGEVEDKETGETRKTTDKKALIAFEGKDKRLAANFINCTLIEAMFGPEIEGWPGHAVTLGVDKVEVKGAMFGKPCVRIFGSPELTEDITVEMKMPRKKHPIRRVLVPTPSRAADGTKTASDDTGASTEPQDDFWPESGPDD
jgi:hypothetical protein